MNTDYLKKESTIKKCIEEGKDYYSSYQMQVIKSKFYTAITFNKEDEEYKKRIDELYSYAKDTLSKNIERLKRKQNKEKAELNRKLKFQKIHNYILEKDKNTNERSIAFKDRTPLPPKIKKNDKDFKKINSIYDVREKLLTTNDIYSLFGEDHLDMELYIKTMIDHSILNYVAKDKINEKYPRYIETRHEMFEYISSIVTKPEFNINEFISNILNDEVLLRQFMYEVNPYYLDKISEDYKLIKKEISKQKKANNQQLKVLNFIESSVSSMKLSDEVINYILKDKNNIKTKTL